MKKLLLAIFIGFTLNAAAQNAHEQTLKLLQVMELDKTMDGMMGNILNSIPASTFKNDKQAAEFNTYFKSEMKAYTDKSIAAMVPLYEKYFTSAEMQKYIDFYSTPEGKKLIESGPVLQKQLMTSMATTDMAAMMQGIQKKMAEIMAEN